MKAAKIVAAALALATAGAFIFISSIGNKIYAFDNLKTSSLQSSAATNPSDGASAPLSKDWKVIFPEDPNKFLVVTTCNNCHGLEQIVTRRGDKGFWSDIVYTMISNGADIQDEDAAKIIKYLSTNLDDSKPMLKVPVNVNTATVDVLRLLPPIAGHAEDIVKTREDLKGFQKVDDLLQVKGLTKEELDKVRAFISVSH
jgi:hypothetical protein